MTRSWDRSAGDPAPRMRGGSPDPAPALRGRGTPENPANRFEAIACVPDREALAALDGDEDHAAGSEPAAPPTLYLRDPTRRLIARNDSPDVPFDASINPYRGCEHGCIYCYARPSHEYLGFSAGLDFETRILVKEDAPELLRRELAAPAWRPQLLGLSGVTDPYQPIERRLRLVRRCLEVLLDFRNPVGIVTKSGAVTRDVDLLRALAGFRAVSVGISLTTLDPALARVMEPRASAPSARLRAIERLAAAGVPVHAMIAPVIPGLTDHEIPRLVEAAAGAGASAARYLLVRLPHAVAPLFEDWLARHFPERAAKVLARLRALRGGRLNDPRFGVRMKGEGPFAEQIAQLFSVSARRHGLDRALPELSTAAFRRPGASQGELFG